VPHGFATAIHTPQGTILHTGDWKLDLNPVDGRHTDLSVMGAIAQNEGIRLLLSDSTNADSPGHSRSETSVGAVLYDLMHAHEGRRVIVTCFASHIHRVQQIADAAASFGRRVATLGLSMKKNVALAREMGVLRIPDHVLIDIEDIDPLDPGQVCVISTGSQGEPMSALARLAAGENRWLTVQEHDTVILSSHPIPGNESSVSKVIDGLTRLGAKVVHTGIADVHATGHAKQEELKTLISVTRPEWMVPVHGEYRHLVAHAELARQMGVAADQVIVCEDGDRLELGDDGLRKVEPVPAGYLYVDGTVGDVGQGVLRDRRVLAEEGVVVVIVTVDLQTGAVITGPEIVTRGWVYAPEAEDLLDAAAEAVRDEIKRVFSSDGTVEHETLQRHVRKAAGKFVNEQTKRRPMIVPVVLEA
jgi:ribonuclease J